MNKIPNSSHMIGKFFREGKSLSPQSRYSLSHGIIKSFYIVCLTSNLSYSSVSFFRKNYSVTIVRTVFSSYSETLDLPLVANLPNRLETLILRLAIKNCPKYC